MFHDLYFLTCDCIRREIEHIFSAEEKFRGIKPVFFPSEASYGEKINEIINELNCDNDILVLCEKTCPLQASSTDDYSGALSINTVEHFHDLFISESVLQRDMNSGTLVLLPGCLEQWQEYRGTDKKGMPFLNPDEFSSVLVLDTGLYSDIATRAREFEELTGLPSRIIHPGLANFSINIENMILRRNLEKKKDQLKLSQKKAASYAMSLDFIREIADMNDESEAIDSICKLLETLFAPEDTFYIPLDQSQPCGMEHSYSAGDIMAVDSLKRSNADYLIFDSEDGFAVKVSSKEDILGIVGVRKVTYPGYIDEYLSIALDLAKAAGLAISNIRRYYEIFSSREEQVKLTDMLRTTNRILRHDIANDLQVITVSMDLLSDKYEDKFIDMSRQAVQRSISLIRNMRDMDHALSPDKQLDLQSVKSVVTNVIDRYDAEFGLEGDCLVMIDQAFFSVIDNIVSNALVHGSASRIDINIEEQDGSCKISISDNGSGIPDDIKTQVFDEGFKYGKTGHTGFGLYIVKKTIERYNGTISVRDNEQGGATFMIELPLGIE
ncbi:MAG: ATP-binding region, ATPase-like protein [Methanolobus sp. T82-4]|nr:MAG: ATP-binding region, ATPase-like protein [Methanolobus sp. T82-4]